MRTISRLLIVAAIAATTLVAIPAAQAANPGGTFTDDDQNIHEGYIEAIAAAGITTGCNPPFNTEYCPNQIVTRGQMAAFLVRALGLTSDGGKDWFTDDGDSVFESDINKLAAAGVTSGCGNNNFCPDRSLTRAEMASFLVRGYRYPSTSTDAFDDDGTSIHEDAINRLSKAGITAIRRPTIASARIHCYDAMRWPL